MSKCWETLIENDKIAFITKYTEIAVKIGTAEQIRATVRHGINVFKTKMISIPIEAQMNPQIKSFHTFSPKERSIITKMPKFQNTTFIENWKISRNCSSEFLFKKQCILVLMISVDNYSGDEICIFILYSTLIFI